MRNVVVVLSLFFFGNSFAQKLSERLAAQYKSQITSTSFVQESDDFVITNAYESTVSGLIHIYFSQRLNGLEVMGTESSIHVSKNGELVHSNDGFIRISSEEKIPSEIPKKSAVKGIEAALTALNYPSYGRFNESVNTEEPHFFLTNEAYDFGKIKTQLKYFRTKNNALKLCWVYLIQDLKNGEGWTVFVDAQSAEVFNVYDWEQACLLNEGISFYGPMPEDIDANCNGVEETMPVGCSNCYEVIPLPFESP